MWYYSERNLGSTFESEHVKVLFFCTLLNILPRRQEKSIERIIYRDIVLMQPQIRVDLVLNGNIHLCCC